MNGRGLAGAYDLAGVAWEEGPARLVYDRLAGVVVGRSPVPLTGRVVLDVGAGTGAAGRQLLAAGARPVAVDLSAGMLRANPAGAGRAVVADAVRLPVASGRVDGVVAAFSFNHLADPAAGLREATRVCRAASPVLVAAYAADDRHPVKEVVDRALVEAGWVPEAWYDEVRRSRMPQLATLEGMVAAARRAGLGGGAGQVERLVVDVSDLRPGDLVTWRLGTAQVASFLAGLDPAARRAVRDRAVGLLGEDPPPLRRSIIVYAGLT